MKVLVVGASRGSGLAVARELIGRGHQVTAFARSATSAGLVGAECVDGDVMDAADVEKVMIGQDAVVVTLGISDNPLGVRLTRRAGTPLDVRSAGTRQVVEAMQRQGVRRLVAQTTYGLGDGWAHLSLVWKAIFTLLLKPQLEDSARQEEAVRGSGLDWTLVRPVSLVDDETDEAAYVDLTDARRSLKVARAQVARVEADALEHPEWIGRTLSVS